MFVYNLQHYHYITTFIDRVHDASIVIHQQAFIIDNLQEEIKGLKKDRAPTVVVEVEARRVELA